MIRGTITSSIPTVKRLFIDREEVEDILIDDYDAPFSEPNPSFAFLWLNGADYFAFAAGRAGESFYRESG